jgi:hypothetical protein
MQRESESDKQEVQDKMGGERERETVVGRMRSREREELRR